jgi:hypothetical protein
MQYSAVPHGYRLAFMYDSLAESRARRRFSQAQTAANLFESIVGLAFLQEQLADQVWANCNTDRIRWAGRLKPPHRPQSEKAHKSATMNLVKEAVWNPLAV